MYLRRANPADADAVLTLWKAAEATESITDTTSDIRRISAKEHVAFILAIVDESVVGSVIAAFDGWRGNMYRLATHPDYRRKGIARLLVNEAEKVFDEWGVKRTTALVEKDHPWAVHFWKDVGYVLDERVSRYVRNASQPRGGITNR
jgi:ribosomal protein S18 acetylase RimI-like enzyme